MTRHIPLVAALLTVLALPGTARPAQGEESPAQRESDGSGNREVRLNYQAAQAALFAGLAYANALESLAGEAGSEDMDLARSHIHTIQRELQGVGDSSVKVGQAMHSAEDHESMKVLRNELAEAAKSIDAAQDAVDGHGALGPHAKSANAHMQQAMIALLQLGTDIGVKPSPAPGVALFKEAATD